MHLVSDTCFIHPMAFVPMASKNKVHPIHVIEVRSANEDLEEVQETSAPATTGRSIICTAAL